MSSSDAISVGSEGRDTYSVELELRAAYQRIAELERILCDSSQRKQARERKPATVEAATQTEEPQSKPAESSILVRSANAKMLVRGPKWNPAKAWCHACKVKGHSISQCPLGFEDRVQKSREHCVHGYHLAYLHGVWRCQWCSEHLQSKEVRRQQPDYYFSQAKVEWAKVQKYGSPFEGLA